MISREIDDEIQDSPGLHAFDMCNKQGHPKLCLFRGTGI